MNNAIISDGAEMIRMALHEVGRPDLAAKVHVVSDRVVAPRGTLEDEATYHRAASLVWQQRGHKRPCFDCFLKSRDTNKRCCAGCEHQP